MTPPKPDQKALTAVRYGMAADSIEDAIRRLRDAERSAEDPESANKLRKGAEFLKDLVQFEQFKLEQ